MSAEDDDALREMAANRGCKLVKSRVKTPGRGDYGRFGLKDAKTGKAVFGFGKAGLTASADEIEAFLRKDAAAGWRSSVGAVTRRRARPAPEQPPKPEPEPEPEPELVIREAKPGDAPAAAALIVALGYDVTPAAVRSRIAALRKAGDPPLVAEQGGLIGILTTNVMQVLHRPRPVGRITMLVVAEKRRGAGVGTALLAEAEARLAARGCGLVEVTSNVKRSRAHAFYERSGYARTSYRFAKPLERA